MKESDVNAIIASSSSSTDEQSQPLQQEQQQQQFSSSSNSLLAVAPLASSISVTSSLNSARQPIINHSISWSTTTDAAKSDALRVGRTLSLLNNNNPAIRSNSDVNNEIEQLKERLKELEQHEETFVFDSTSQQEYLQLQTRLKSLEEKQFHSRR